jgi:hypothetical protein
MTTYTETCSFSNPVRYDGTTPTLPTHSFFFKDRTCTNDKATSSPIDIPQSYNPTTTINASSSIQIYGSMSAGEVLISLFLFIIIILLLFKMLISSLDRVKTKKKFLAYSNSEVEVKDVL